MRDKHAIDCLLWDVWKLAPVYFTPLVMQTHCKDQTLYITGHSFSLTIPSHIRISAIFLWIEGCVNFHKTNPVHKRCISMRHVQQYRGLILCGNITASLSNLISPYYNYTPANNCWKLKLQGCTILATLQTIWWEILTSTWPFKVTKKTSKL
jgi:hypothetical protein